MVKFISKILLILSSILISPKVVLAEIWSKTLDGGFYYSLVNTPFGIATGEKDSRTQLQPYNGILLSNDLGTTWKQIGLNGRGVSDIFSAGLDIYAATYYQKNNINGCFYSSNKGGSWNHIGPNYSASIVHKANNTLYCGYYSHGLWISTDNGTTFQQKIGTNGFGPTVLSIESNGNITIAGTEGKTYLSNDYGLNWVQITQLNNKLINQVAFADSFIFISTYDLDGIYVSKNNGQNWEKVQSFGTASVGGLFYYKNTLYAGKYDNDAKIYSMFKSLDLGRSWQNTGLNLITTGAVTNISYIYAHPSQLIAAVSKNGLYSMTIEPNVLETFKFLDLPWNAKNSSELVDKIYTFFDHKYPLLGDYLYNEPIDESTTTLNYLGQLAEEPELYYSSHSGIDFALPYGTPVLAPASGVASYYFCKDCGNTIKIDHLNGYQTIYEHLQDNDLLIKSGSKEVTVGQPIGKIGLTGRTSGPHLHFEVINDSNYDNSFSDEFPHGRVDPFVWLNTDFSDPWKNYYWEDPAGNHLGAISKYLWNFDIPQIKKTFATYTNNIVTYENKTFDLTNITSLYPYNFEYQSFSQPRLPITQQNLRYITNTSFILELFDTLNNKITTLPNEISIEITLALEDLQGIVGESLKLYYLDSVSKEWKSLPSVIDLTTGILKASTTHLSRFAVFAEPSDNTPPETMINITGTTESDWYTEPPKITFSSNNTDINKTFYSLDAGSTWNEYISEFTVNQNGFVTLLYRSNDNSGNYEETKNILIKINSQNKLIKQVIIRNNEFDVKLNNNSTT